MSEIKKPAALGEIHDVDLREDYSPVAVTAPPAHPTFLDLSHTIGKTFLRQGVKQWKFAMV